MNVFTLLYFLFTMLTINSKSIFAGLGNHWKSTDVSAKEGTNHAEA